LRRQKNILLPLARKSSSNTGGRGVGHFAVPERARKRVTSIKRKVFQKGARETGGSAGLFPPTVEQRLEVLFRRIS